MTGIVKNLHGNETGGASLAEPDLNGGRRETTTLDTKSGGCVCARACMHVLLTAHGRRAVWTESDRQHKGNLKVTRWCF